ncbi:DUF6443 domain-containing protein [Chitinophaga rhizosphaerae]|uniref:DUF6443 domain-containing protein n=1 Tax=Chitinophaga rhizosphaerae TaxID=1864947 RepID=UPI0013E06579|nr:DUF6443 domain-containing protein [Chitinophaga rhizosphaerae]
MATFAQKPNGSKPAVKAARDIPAAYPVGTKVNYVRTWTPNQPLTDPALVTGATDVTNVPQATAYFDGLGRPLQTVTKGASPVTKKDLVAPVVYDAFGRESFKYLPYVSTAGDGAFKTSPFTDQASFYGTFLDTAKNNEEDIFYSETQFEASPLNRVTKEMAPGNNWTGAGRGVGAQYLVNAVGDSVRTWNVTTTFPNNIPSSSLASPGTYAAGTLFKNVTTDENGKQVVAYKDKEDKVVLKKVQFAAAPGTGHSGWLCTYYAYDDLGNLRFVLPPRAVERLAGASWALSAEVQNNLCFRYEYDGRNRMIVKKVPGADPVEMVYDQRDRLVLTRDGNLRAVTGKWMATVYDNLNRPIMSGIYMSALTHDALSTAMGTATSSSTVTTVIKAIDNLVVSKYETNVNTYKARLSVELTDGFETPAGSSTEVLVDPTMPDASETTTATLSLPGLNGNFYALTYTYYDTLGYPGAKPVQTAYFTKPQAGTNLYAEPVATSSQTKGLVTGTKVRVLDTDQFLVTTTYYDAKGRPVQVLSDNINNGTDIVTTMYDFIGKTLSTYHYHNNPKAGTAGESKLLTNLTYDHAGRVIKVTKQLNDNAAYKRDIATNTYDALGQLQRKEFRNAAGTVIESMDYTYNVRGWNKGINRKWLTGAETHYFGQELHYDEGFENKEYNGNIAGVTWKGTKITAGTVPTANAYGYTYDAASRLLKGNFTQSSNGTTYARTTIVYDAFMGDGADPVTAYDANGNIKQMRHWGKKGTTENVLIDNLAYSYDTTGITAGNRLYKVTDAVNDPATTLGDFADQNTAATFDYAYDKNGNLTKDENKKISAIHYNLLNLPKTISITGKGTISYIYDATGRKLAKTVLDQTVTPNKTTRTEYMGAVIYDNDALQLIGHEEGRIRPLAAGGFTYDYFMKDHLGNVRIVLAETNPPQQLYLASMEPEKADVENATFSNIDASRVDKPVGYPEDPQADKNAFVAKLNGKDADRRIGPSLVLKVKSGDTVRLGARAFYKSQGPNKAQKTTAPAADMAASLIRAFGNPGAAAVDGHGGAEGSNGTPFSNNFVNDSWNRMKERDPKSPANPDRPKVYLNFVLFDEDFNLVEGSSGVKQVATQPDELQTLAQDNVIMEKSGFLYVYTSNETQLDVFFDNVTVTLAGTPVLEETHYYPFGLAMAGLSEKAIYNPENKRKWNKGSELQNKEFSDGSGLELYATPLRSLDPQLGRWWQIDSKPDNAQSLYAAMKNNPISFNDPLGDTVRIRHRGTEVIYNNGVLTNQDGSAYNGKVRGFLKKTVNALNAGRTRSNEAASMITELQGSANNFTIVKGNTNEFNYNPAQRFAAYANQIRTDPAQAGLLATITAAQLAGGAGGTITWDPSGVNVWVVGGGQNNNPITNLMHELFHGRDANRGLTDDRDHNGLNRDEWQASYKENIVRQQMGLPLREYYRSQDNAGTVTHLAPRLLDAANNPILPTWLPVGW